MLWSLLSQVELSRFKVQKLKVLRVVYLEVLFVKLSSIYIELGHFNIIGCFSYLNILFHGVVDD